MLTTFVISGFLLACASLAPGRADDPKSEDFVVKTLEGKVARGPLADLSGDWSVRLGGAGAAKIPGNDVLSLRRADVPIPAPPAVEHLILTNGDRVPFKTLRLEGERLQFEQPLLAKNAQGRLSIGLVALIWFGPPSNTDQPEAFRRELLRTPRKKDVVLLRNGDTLEGVLHALDADKIEVEADKKISTVKRSQVSVVALSTELAEKPKIKGTVGRLILARSGPMSGARFTLVNATCADGKTLTGTAVWGAAIEVPLENVAALDLLSPRAIYLTDLEPKGYEFTAFLGESAPRWPLGRDGTAEGLDLRFDGSYYDRGLGMHSRSSVSYVLPAGYKRFEALAALNQRGGSARVAVVVDGKEIELANKGDLSANKGSLPVNVPVAGAKMLTLVVDFGPRGDVRGLVNWLDPRLIK